MACIYLHFIWSNALSASNEITTGLSFTLCFVYIILNNLRVLKERESARWMHYSFSQLLTHIFWKHASFSQNSKHKSQNHSHKMQNPLYLLQNATLLSKQCYVTSKGYFVFKWQTQTIIWVDISKHRLTTDVLNGKHYYEWENTSMKALSGALCLFMFSVTVRFLLL